MNFINPEFKNLILLLILTFATSLFSFSQINLRIEINELRNNQGKFLLEFNDENKQVLKAYSEEISNNKCIIVIQDINPGKYAFKYFHDENNDAKLNTNFMGIPREGYGFSNNASGKFGPPPFNKMIFEVLQSDTLRCTPSYILNQK